jgi:lipopolysaccharide biosynthesis protein
VGSGAKSWGVGRPGSGTAASTRVIAFYLPQFHPIPENDEWWGKGFTEWTNVAKARPLFRGHAQPVVPGELGFCDLRVPEVREAQAALAREHGVEAFCYWHYWFAGRELLERPLKEVVASGQPDFPFCIGWANHSWTGIWSGAPNRMLIEQTYPGPEDHEAHFRAIESALCDPRYLRVEGKPLVVIYDPAAVPETLRFTDQWRELAVRRGLTGLFCLGLGGFDPPRYLKDGFDGWVSIVPDCFFDGRGDRLKRLHPDRGTGSRLVERVIRGVSNTIHSRWYPSGPNVVSYDEAITVAAGLRASNKDCCYPSVFPGWDNTPRSERNGWVFFGSTAALFRRHVREALTALQNQPAERRLLFVKSWNEWAEGNQLEPDLNLGRAYLEALRAELVAQAPTMLGAERVDDAFSASGYSRPLGVRPSSS